MWILRMSRGMAMVYKKRVLFREKVDSRVFKIIIRKKYKATISVVQQSGNVQ